MTEINLHDVQKEKEYNPENHICSIKYLAFCETRKYFMTIL